MGKRCVPVDANDPAAVARLAGEVDPDLVVVERRGAARPRRRRRAPHPRDARVRPGRRRRPPRGLEGVDEGGPGGSRGADRAPRLVHGRSGGRGARLPGPPARPLRGEDRRARGREGRHRHGVDRRRARCRARLPLGTGVRRRRPHVRHRGRPDRTGAVVAGRVQRLHRRLAAGAGAGLQAHRRRRPRPQHGRDGRVLAGSRRRPRRRGGGHGACRATDAARAGGARHHVPRGSLRRAHAHAGRRQGPRVQRALRRSRGAGRASRVSPATSVGSATTPPPAAPTSTRGSGKTPA